MTYKSGPPWDVVCSLGRISLGVASSASSGELHCHGHLTSQVAWALSGLQTDPGDRVKVRKLALLF